MIVGELSLKSDRFRRLWARHDVRGTGSPSGIIRNPLVGDLTLRREKYAVLGSASLVLVIYHAEPGTPSADAMVLLSTLIR